MEMILSMYIGTEARDALQTTSSPGLKPFLLSYSAPTSETVP